jgi:hypothetical protein
MITRSRADDVFVDVEDRLAFTLRQPLARWHALACPAAGYRTGALQHAAAVEEPIEGDGLGR